MTWELTYDGPGPTGMSERRYRHPDGLTVRLFAGPQCQGQADNRVGARSSTEVLHSGSSFFNDPEDGKTLIRWCFPKRMETLREFVKRIATLKG